MFWGFLEAILGFLEACFGVLRAQVASKKPWALLVGPLGRRLRASKGMHPTDSYAVHECSCRTRGTAVGSLSKPKREALRSPKGLRRGRWHTVQHPEPPKPLRGAALVHQNQNHQNHFHGYQNRPHKTTLGSLQGLFRVSLGSL